ncbi:putative serine/threonine-protein kinase At1g54610 [Bidens hawaiensis]|uniref:putative serine/threonine-protein kinase At1g54610 n=1 Tax=Bidens hawaiensis TaxID=980011 RepID=UPI004049A460
MGGICVKPSGGSPWDRRSSKLSSESRVSQSRRVESFWVKNRAEVRTGSIDKRLNSSRRVRDDHFDSISSIRTIPKAVVGEQVVAGWPSWLAEVAGEAINGWLPRKADTFEKLDKIGQGTYSSVFKARDLISNKFVALKRVRFDNKDLESVVFMAREILILRRLDHPNIIKLEGLITSRSSCSLYLVFEYMEHDLTGLVTLPGVKFTEPQVKCYMKQLLNGLDHCHGHGVLHRDIKGSNLLIDNNGILKIADFGLANYYKQSQIVPLTSRVVTLWYRPPELLLGETHYGVGVDLWSAGCILGELYAGKPIMPGRTEVEQLHRIFKLCGSPSDSYWSKSKLPHSTAFKPAHPYKRRILEAFKDFPAAAIGLMQTLLAIDPEERGTAALALKSEFFTIQPHACDPSSLPKYPPSKEIDAKMREEEAKRQRAARMNEQKLDKETGAVPAQNANAELTRSTLVSIEKPAIYKGSNDGGKRSPPMRGSYSGPLAAGAGGVTSTRSKAAATATAQPTKYLNLSQNMGGPPCRVGSGRASMKETNMDGEGYKGNKIQFSGPLVSSNVDQMLKDHDRHIQQAARRARLEKTRLGEVEAEMIRNAVYPSSRLAK